MIKRKTVLVLGAGASFEYGFPLSLSLCQNIINIADGLSNQQELDNLSLTRVQLQNFSHAFKRAAVSSIDEFLSTRNDFIDVGKVLIAKALLPYEKDENLFDNFGDKIKENWYRYLLQNMVTNKLEDFHKNSISFITFNYDRSLEHFLFASLKARYDAQDQDVAAQLNKINFIHPHGQLGLLLWQLNNKKLPIVNYSSKVDSTTILNASKCIKIIHEANEKSEEFLIAQKLISEADEVFFLGFGYHPDNLRRLQLPSPGSKVVAGTAKDLGKMGIFKAVSYSHSFIGEKNLHDVSIVELFKNHHRLH